MCPKCFWWSIILIISLQNEDCSHFHFTGEKNHGSVRLVHSLPQGFMVNEVVPRFSCQSSSLYSGHFCSLGSSQCLLLLLGNAIGPSKQSSRGYDFWVGNHPWSDWQWTCVNTYFCKLWSQALGWYKPSCPKVTALGWRGLCPSTGSVNKSVPWEGQKPQTSNEKEAA